MRLTAGAIDRGIVFGGGKALAVTASFLSAETAGGRPDFMLTALTAPLRQLAVNAGIFDAGAVVSGSATPSSDEAFDARTGEFSDLASWTVFDSADVMVTVVSSATRLRPEVPLGPVTQSCIRSMVRPSSCAAG